MADFKIGIVQVDYTPRIGLPLMGNFRDDYASRGVHDPLYSKAMVIENSRGAKVALVSLDICMVRRAEVAFMRELISRQTGIPPERILIAATHTHGGPALAQTGGRPGTPEADIRKFLKEAAGAVALAGKNKKASQLRIGYARENRISFNRRLLCKDGKMHMNWEQLDPDCVVRPLGPIDPEVIALAVFKGEQPRAVAVNFALHPAILAGDNWLYSADFPAYLYEAMRKICGTGLTTLFFNGCCGNINHIDYADPLQGRGYQMTQRVGYMLAAAAQEALKKSVEIRGDTIAVSGERMRVERIKVSEKDRKWSEMVLKAEKDRKTKGQVDGVPDLFYAQRYLEMYHKQDEDDHLELMAIRIGDLGIVGLPGEIFCEFGIEIKKRSPARHTLVIELANDGIGYFPIKRALKEGGLGATVGTTMYAPGSGEKMTKTVIQHLNSLF